MGVRVMNSLGLMMLSAMKMSKKITTNHITGVMVCHGVAELDTP